MLITMIWIVLTKTEGRRCVSVGGRLQRAETTLFSSLAPLVAPGQEVT